MLNLFKLATGALSAYKDQIILYVAVVLIVALGYMTYLVQHKNVVIAQQETAMVKSEADANKCKFELSIQNHFIQENAIDQAAKDAEYAAAMAAKPKWKTKIEYINVGEECKDLVGIIDESMASRTTGGAQ